MPTKSLPIQHWSTSGWSMHHLQGTGNNWTLSPAVSKQYLFTNTNNVSKPSNSTYSRKRVTEHDTTQYYIQTAR